MHLLHAGVTVRPATRLDTRRLLMVLTDAFMDGPLADWLVPEAADRGAVAYRYSKLMVDLGLRHGQVDTTTDLAAVAIWYRRDEWPPTFRDRAGRLARATGAYGQGFTMLDGLLDAHHPRLPHEHLAFLAVDRQMRGRGLGSTLLEVAHRRLDIFNRAAYVVATDPASRDLYARHGYQPAQPLRPGAGCPQVWPMWRPQTGGGVR